MLQTVLIDAEFINESLVNAAEYIIRSFYAPLTSFIYVSWQTVNKPEVVSNTLHKLNYEIAYVINNMESDNAVDGMRFYNLYIVDSYEHFRYVYFFLTN